MQNTYISSLIFAFLASVSVATTFKGRLEKEGKLVMTKVVGGFLATK